MIRSLREGSIRAAPARGRIPMPAGIGERSAPLFSLLLEGERTALPAVEKREQAWRLRNAAFLSPEVVTFGLSSII